MKKEKRLYLKLLSSTFSISAFTFGGGYVIVPLMKKKFVDDLKWIEEEEMLNLIAISQSSPGPIAINTSLLLGYRVAGIPGALISLLGTVLPPLVVISIISLFYNAFRDNAVVSAVMKGMQSGIAAVIADVVINMGRNITNKKDAISILVMILAFAASFVFGISVVYIILGSGLFGAVRTLLREKHTKSAGKGGEAQ